MVAEVSSDKSRSEDNVSWLIRRGASAAEVISTGCRRGAGRSAQTVPFPCPVLILLIFSTLMAEDSRNRDLVVVIVFKPPHKQHLRLLVGKSAGFCFPAACQLLEVLVLCCPKPLAEQMSHIYLISVGGNFRRLRFLMASPLPCFASCRGNSLSCSRIPPVLFLPSPACLPLSAAQGTGQKS